MFSFTGGFKSLINKDCLILQWISVRSVALCRNKDNVSGGARGRRRREPLGGSVGMLPQKILKSRGLEMLFPAFSKSYLWFTHIANYLLRTLSQQTNAHWEYNTWNVNYKTENRLPHKESNNWEVLNYCLIVAKYNVFATSVCNGILDFDSFLLRLNNKTDILRTIAFRSNRLSQFKKTWDKLL